MIDFMRVSTRTTKRGTVEIYPKFVIKNPSEHLMIRGGDFYAVWLEEKKLWSTSEQDVINLIDRELDRYVEENRSRFDQSGFRTMYMWDAESGSIDAWHKYCQRQMRDSFHTLDETLIFANTETTKESYASKKLPYPLEPGEPQAWNRMISVLYDEKERHKIEWAIGSIVSGDSRDIQKFMVFYGAAGTGKSTIINVINKLFEGYTCTFSAKALGSSSNAFALEAFRDNPLVAIEHDGDLSHIEDNTRLNSLVSHETMQVNEKFKAAYANRFRCFLFMGTNKPVRITDAKSGLIRRLIDVSPTGEKLPAHEYKTLMKQIGFELGQIANHCLEVYKANPGAYDNYIPLSMMGASNDFYNFVMDSWSVFKSEDQTTLKAAWEMYKTYCEEAKVAYPYPRRAFMEELKNYFREYTERQVLDDGTRVRNLYSGFLYEKFEEGLCEKEDEKAKISPDENSEKTLPLGLAKQESLFDREMAACPAQYGSESGTPVSKWVNVKTTLADIHTDRVHYVKVPENHIVIDFDIPGEDGQKCFEKNAVEAAKWPPTYAEVSKSGAGIHLHYIYAGDPSQLSCVYDNKIEVKVFTGNSSLRRKLTLCNNLPIATISSGLPFKEAKKTINFDTVKSEKSLRNLIERNLRKEIHPNTKPSVDFIFKNLSDAYASGLTYDVRDMQPAVIKFAAKSSHQADYCLRTVAKMKFCSEDTKEAERIEQQKQDDEKPIIFFDIEVFPNLFLVNWKAQGEGKPVARMINPSPQQIESLIGMGRLVGFNNLKYDNSMLYGRLIGYSNEQMYQLSQRIIDREETFNGFREAKNISYTDVYDYAAKKQSLKKWEIELGIHHQELGLPWDEPVPEERWEEVARYCDNDVLATEAVFNATKGDFAARQILADWAGLTPNDTTNTLTTRIIFGRERHPQLVYTHLEETFPGYEFRKWREGDTWKDDGKFHNVFMDTDIGYGGYIRSWPGMYGNVGLLDVESLHPHSIVAMNCFGEYTKNFADILKGRLAIKHGDLEEAKRLLPEKVRHYLDDSDLCAALSQALKIAINSVYGLTSASFDNPFRDKRNVNNIVALRGALFMRTLQAEVEKRGFSIAAIKTDSIKIVDATPEIVAFASEFAEKYGYHFDFEACYEKMCQVNDADYVAMYKTAERCQAMFERIPKDNKKHGGEWTVTGAKFAQPYVFKKLFTHADISFDDLCETKSVKTAIYLDYNEKMPDVTPLEKVRDKLFKKMMNISSTIFPDPEEMDLFKQVETLDEQISHGHCYKFVGRVGQFTPVAPGQGGGLLVAKRDDKYTSVTGTKGYRWLESETIRNRDWETMIDYGYYTLLADDAKAEIEKYGDFEWFASEDLYDVPA